MSNVNRTVLAMIAAALVLSACSTVKHEPAPAAAAPAPMAPIALEPKPDRG